MNRRIYCPCQSSQPAGEPGQTGPAGQEANPYLPPAPADGLHYYGLQDSHRCHLCGAYSFSDEGGRPCKGGFAESESMRHQAAALWLTVKASQSGPAGGGPG